MFAKLIRGINFKPTSLDQLAFYSRRLKKEKSIRALGALLMVATLLVQIVAAAFPAERSYAASNNDIIRGGVTSKADLTSTCKTNADVRAVYARFDVSCDHIASGTTKLVTINSNAYNYWSVGRTPLSSNGISSDDWGEVRMSAGGSTIYQRPLRAWGNVNYEAFQVTANGKNFWIIKNCGNITTIGPYTKKPSLEVKKQLLTANQVKPGDTVKFRISYRNPVDESVAIDFRLRDLLSPHLELIGMDGRNAFIDNDPVTNLKGLGGSATFREVTVAAKVKAGTAHGTEICNIARVSADVVGVVDSNKVCVTVVNPPPPPAPTPPAPAPTPPPPTPTPTPPPPQTPMCTVPGKTNLPANSPDCKTDEPKCTIPGKTHLPANSPECKPDEPKCTVPGKTHLPANSPDCKEDKPKCTIPGKEQYDADSPQCKYDEPDGFCVASSSFLEGSNKDFKVVTKSSVSGTTKVVKYHYTLDNNTSSVRQVMTSDLSNEQVYKNLAPGDHTVRVVVEFTNESKKSISKECVAEITVAEDAKVTRTKSVTREGQDMDGKKVSANDVLVFKLTTRNITATPYMDYEGEDYFGDVLDYAEFVDEKELDKQGLVLGDDMVLRWKVDKIAGNSEDVKTVTVKVKKVTPSTNRPSDNSSDYDCIISNKYGNQVTMSMSCPLVKTIERTSGKLPDTGPGTTVAISFVATVIAGYFFARARVLARETDIIRRMQHFTGLGV